MRESLKSEGKGAEFFFFYKYTSLSAKEFYQMFLHIWRDFTTKLSLPTYSTRRHYLEFSRQIIELKPA